MTKASLEFQGARFKPVWDLQTVGLSLARAYLADLGVAAGDGCLLSLDSQLPLIAGQVGGGRHQRIYGPHRARYKLDIPVATKQRGLAQCTNRPVNMSDDSSAACIGVSKLRQKKQSLCCFEQRGRLNKEEACWRQTLSFPVKQ